MKKNNGLLLIWMALLLAVAASPVMAANKGVSVLLLGDDFLNNYGIYKEEDKFSAQFYAILEKRPHIKVTIKNISMDGATTGTGLSMLPRIIEERPDIFVLALGINDALARENVDVVYNNVDNMLRELDRAGIYVLLVGPQAPPGVEHEYAARFNNVFPKLAQHYRVVFMQGGFAEIAGNPLYTLQDRLHANRFGMEKIARAFIEPIERMHLAIRKSRRCLNEHNRKYSAWCKKHGL